MSALLEGFRTGWGAMNQHNQQQENTRRYDQQFARQETQDGFMNEMRANQNAILQNQVDRIPTTNQNADRATDQQFALGENNLALSDNTISQLPQQNAYLNQSREQQLTAGALNNTVAQNQVDRLPQTNQMTDDMNAVNLSSAELGLDQQQKQVLNQDLQRAIATRDPEVMGEFIAKNKDYLSGTNMAPLSTLEGIQSGVALGNAMDTGDFATATTAANSFFKPQLNKAVGQPGKDGKLISNVEITGIQDEGEGYKIPVMVTTEGGNKYPSFISQLRSADPNDPQKNFSPDELIGTIKATHSVAKLLASSSYYGRLMQNAQNVKAAETPTAKPNYKEVTGAMGNTTGYFDPALGKYVPLPDGALNNTMVTSQEELTDNKEQEAFDKKSSLITKFGSDVMQSFQGIDQKEALTIAKNMVDRVEAAKSSGQTYDQNAIAQEEFNKYISTRKQLQIDNAAQSKNVDRGIAAYNNPYAQR
jgi:hypothetical protein